MAQQDRTESLGVVPESPDCSLIIQQGLCSLVLMVKQVTVLFCIEMG